tara:strand:- start:18981 stop:22769 length:3789 start_codon:yes stop_codon:yes gene_type:complete
VDDGSELCFYVDSQGKLSDRELRQLQWLIAETYQSGNTQMEPALTPGSFIEIGPRLNVETPFSSNAVAISHAMGITKIRRIEHSVRYIVTGSQDKATILADFLDPMTQVVYQNGLLDFGPTVKPEPVKIIPLLECGENALRALNTTLGLGMDDADIRRNIEMYQRLERNPTDVELFQDGNANSEHSRHWVFRSPLVIDGVTMSETLFDIVRSPLLAKDDSNSILAFNDNAGAIVGFRVPTLEPISPGTPCSFTIHGRVWHITATAETHNHPTLIAPFPGAETGSGGRIRDNSAAGRGSLPIAGLAGYCVGNLHLLGYPIPGEIVGGEEIRGQATPSRILIEGSDGVSDYGNKFGEPLIGGFTRTFGQVVSNERLEFRKPVLYTAGQGQIAADQTKKHDPEIGMCIVAIGSPMYRVGVGGGAASSMLQGENDADLDFNSVQRGDAEMENKANRVIRACIEMGSENPIESIHDQGAGGPSNVLTELVEKTGGKIDIRQIVLGDRTMSVLEIWSAETQERYGLLVRRSNLARFQAICEREGTNCEVVGEVTDDRHITVIDSDNDTTPVHLDLHSILTGLAQKTFESERIEREFAPFVPPSDLTVNEALEMIFRLPQIGSKGYLVHKVDRSVTGRIVQQQCCGPAQIPVANVSVTANGFFDTTGAATALGEQPIKMLLNSGAGARMAVGEMLTNMVSACISDLGDVVCRANWMWPAKLPGEMPRLYDAATAMRDIMLALGIAIDGGKDSLSMAATIDGSLVKSPGQLVIMGYAPVPNIAFVCTPDIKRPGNSNLGLIDLGNGKNRLGGSSLAQAFGQTGDTSPDVDDPAFLACVFRAVQEAISNNQILSLHDRSDGGLITTLVEMCLSGFSGAEINLENNADVLAKLFSEELGLLLEYAPEQEANLQAIFDSHGVSFVRIGRTMQAQTVVIKQDGQDGLVFLSSLDELRVQWEATSSRLEEIQTDVSDVKSERRCHAKSRRPVYQLTFDPAPTMESGNTRPAVAILRQEGTNGDREMAAACFAAGLGPFDVTMSDLQTGRSTLDQFQGLMFPGGFSFMDVFGSGKGWAGVIRYNKILKDQFDSFYSRPDTFSLGVCNGCQLMALLGWVPGNEINEASQPRFIHNHSGRFESRFAQVKILPSPAVLLRGMEGSTLGVWIAHGEGRLIFPDSSVNDMVREKDLAPLIYTDPSDLPTEVYPYNPNGSPNGFTALCSEDGRHLAMMPHPERCFQKWQWPWMPEEWKDTLAASPWLHMFQNARSWCEEQKS